MTKKNKLLKILYQKWVLEAVDAEYYGTASDAVRDFKRLFRLLKWKSK